MTDSTQRCQFRIRLLAIFALLWMGLIAKQLIQLQVFQASELRARAERQQQYQLKLNPLRGTILDRNGQELVRSIEVESVYAAPAEITDVPGVAAQLAETLALAPATVTERLTNGRNFVAIKRRISFAEADRLRTQPLPGVHLVKEPKRFYLQGSLAAPLLGLSNIDGEGVSGLERAYESVLAGRAGRLVRVTDAHGRVFDHEETAASPGQTLTLTLDGVLQTYAEQALSEAVQASKARGGVAIVIRPQTGEILALANAPTFDPNHLSSSQDISFVNRATEVPYEPGSVMKVITYAAALEEKLIKPHSILSADQGAIKVGNHTIRDSHSDGALSATEALARSSNVVAIKLGRSLGLEKLHEYLKRFGLGERASRDLASESPGLVRPFKYWKETSYGSIPIGYEMVATPLQLAAMIATIANDGVLVQPHIVLKTKASSGTTVPLPPPATRQVISRETAVALRRMLASVILDGTAKKAQILGYTAGGKTGTAHKYDPAIRRYSSSYYYASFVGFAPLEQPAVAIAVMLDGPRGEYHGGQVAAPVFKRIAEAALNRLGIPPDDLASLTPPPTPAQVVEVPEAFEETALPAGAGLNDLGLADAAVIALASDAVVADVVPEATTEPLAQATASAPTPPSAPAPELLRQSVLVPDLRGRGARSAAEICAQLGLKVNAQGTGVVITQKPGAGEYATQGTTCYLTLGN